MSDHAAERLARLTNKAQNLDGMPPGYGGTTSADIAASLAGVEDVGYYTALVVYARQYEMRDKAEKALWLRVVDLAAKQRWSIDRPGILRLMAKMAVYEVVRPPKCWRCNGRGSIRSGGTLVAECGECLGTGRGSLGVRELADAADMPKSTWHRVWHSRYLKVAALAAASLDAAVLISDRHLSS